MYFTTFSQQNHSDINDGSCSPSSCLQCNRWHEQVSQVQLGSGRLEMMNNLCVCLQQFERGVEAAELRAFGAVKAEYTGEWSNEAGSGRSSQEARDS